jgi:hypothetical protein
VGRGERFAGGGGALNYNSANDGGRLVPCMKVRFYIDPETGEPHIHNHDVSEEEVTEVLENVGEDRPGREGSRLALGKTNAGRYLRVISIPDPEPDSIFVITAYELRGKPLAAYRSRRRKKGRQ